MSLRTIVKTDFGPEAEITTFLHMRKEKWPKRLKCFLVIEIFHSYRKSGPLNAVQLSVLWAEAR